MQNENAVSRRSFGLLIGAGALLTAVPAPLRAKPASGPVRLSANENPYGPSPAAVLAMRDSLASVPRYPDELLDALAEDLAAHHGVSRQSILLGDGSSDILRIASAAFIPHRLVTADPSFEAIAIYAGANGREIVKVPLDSSHAHDLAKMADGDLVYICNPNNPTGTITPAASMRAFLERVPSSTMVLVDEAYHHYAGSPDYATVIPLIAKHPNLIVARTFSKIYAMAGLRCGYAVAQPAVIERMGAHQQWDAMNVVALTGARASLRDHQHVELGRKRNADTRAWLTAELRKSGFEHLPSEANFVMIDVRREVRPLIASLRAKGVQVGRLFPAMPHHLRVTIGTPSEMERFIVAFREAVA